MKNNTRYVFYEKDKSGYIVIDIYSHNIYGIATSLKLLEILIDNKIKLFSSTNLVPMNVSKEEARDLLFIGCRFYFNGYKDNEELIDLLCGNDWPSYLKEFIEKTIVSLTKEKL